MNDEQYVFGSLNTWGWVAWVIGVIQMLVGVGIWLKNQLARWVAVIGAVLNAIAQLLFIPAYPFRSLTLFGVGPTGLWGPLCVR